MTTILPPPPPSIFTRAFLRVFLVLKTNLHHDPIQSHFWNTTPLATVPERKRFRATTRALVAILEVGLETGEEWLQFMHAAAATLLVGELTGAMDLEGLEVMNGIVHSIASSVPGMRLVYQAPELRHFSARFELQGCSLKSEGTVESYAEPQI